VFYGGTRAWGLVNVKGNSVLSPEQIELMMDPDYAPLVQMCFHGVVSRHLCIPGTDRYMLELRFLGHMVLPDDDPMEEDDAIPDHRLCVVDVIMPPDGAQMTVQAMADAIDSAGTCSYRSKGKGLAERLRRLLDNPPRDDNDGRGWLG
jgi:hypothetical protein